MDNKELLQHYEKQYLHEIDIREKTNARLQTPLAIVISFVGVLAFLLQNYRHTSFTCIPTIFCLLLAAAVFCLILALYFFKEAWHGNEYNFMPSAQTNEHYRQSLIAHYAPYEDCDTLAVEKFDAYLMGHYIKYATFNSECNDLRSFNIHRTNKFIIIAAGLAFLAFMAFYFGGLDKASHSSPTEVKIVGPLTIVGENMSDTKAVPPPPPPPPAARVVREGQKPAAPVPKPAGK